MLYFLIPWLVGIAVVDFARRRVSNQWLLAGALFAIGTLAKDGSPLAVTWQQGLTGGIGAFVVLLGFYALGMMGAGDVKFAGVLGLWLGGGPLMPIAIGAGLLAGIHAFSHLARHGRPSLPGRRDDDGDMSVDGATSADAADAASAMNGAIPYAGYLALMALLWLALRLVPPSP